MRWIRILQLDMLCFSANCLICVYDDDELVFDEARAQSFSVLDLYKLCWNNVSGFRTKLAKFFVQFKFV